MNRKRLDGYLSRKIQAIYGDALIYVESGGPVEVWTMVRPGKPVLELGGSFSSAKQAVTAMLAASKKCSP